MDAGKKTSCKKRPSSKKSSPSSSGDSAKSPPVADVTSAIRSASAKSKRSKKPQSPKKTDVVAENNANKSASSNKTGNQPKKTDTVQSGHKKSLTRMTGTGTDDHHSVNGAAVSRPTTATTAKMNNRLKSSLSSRKSGGTARGSSSSIQCANLGVGRHQNERRGSTSSVGEIPLTPTHGDVHTLVCDVSPVPSDVESNFEYSTAIETGSTAQGSAAYLEKQSRLRPGRQIEESTNVITDNMGLYSAFTRDRHEETETSGVPRSKDCKSTATTDGDVSKDTKSASVINKSISKKSGPSSPTSKRASGKSAAGEMVDPKSGHPTSNTLRSITAHRNKNQLIANRRDGKSTASTAKIESEIGKALETEDSKQKDKTEVISQNENPSSNDNKVVVVVVVTPATESSDLQVPSSQPDSSLSSSIHGPTTPSVEFSPSTVDECEANFAADAECRRAFTVLNARGFNVSLHTLRRALLTPTEYRTLSTSTTTGRRSDGSPPPRRST